MLAIPAKRNSARWVPKTASPILPRQRTEWAEDRTDWAEDRTVLAQ